MNIAEDHAVGTGADQGDDADIDKRADERSKLPATKNSPRQPKCRVIQNSGTLRNALPAHSPTE